MVNFLLFRGSYVNREVGKEGFKNKFSLDAWMNLKRSEKEKHRAKDCKHCPTIQEFGNKKANVAIVDTFKKKEQAAMARRPQIVIQKIRECRCSKNNTRIKAKVKAKIIRDYLTKLRQEQISTHTTALFASKLSIRAYSRLRIRMHCKYVKNKPKCHVGKLENYVCNKEIVKRALEAAAGGSKELGTSMTGKWTELARKAKLQKRHGLPVTRTLNCGQVRKLFCY